MHKVLVFGASVVGPRVFKFMKTPGGVVCFRVDLPSLQDVQKWGVGSLKP